MRFFSCFAISIFALFYINMNYALADPIAIETLTCGKFIQETKAKNPGIMEVMIWLHGVSVGIDKTMNPFNRQFIAGANLFVVAGCQNPNTPILQAFLAGKDRVITNLSQ